MTISTFFLGDRGSALIVFRRLLEFALLYQFLVLHDGCGDGGGCEDSVVEHCEDTVVDVDGNYDKEASISSLFLLQCAALSQPAIACSKLTIETLEKGVKYVQS